MTFLPQMSIKASYSSNRKAAGSLEQWFPNVSAFDPQITVVETCVSQLVLDD